MLGIMEQPDRGKDVIQVLGLYRKQGRIDHTLTLAIPPSARIPALITNDQRARVSAALSGSLVSAFSNMNLKYTLNDDQVFELAEAIIDESFEDYLSLEDVLLFLRDLVLGKRGDIGYQMDMPKFFRMFEDYRQERHEAMMAIRDEQRSKFKAMGGGGIDRKKDRIDTGTILELYREFISGDESQES